MPRWSPTQRQATSPRCRSDKIRFFADTNPTRSATPRQTIRHFFAPKNPPKPAPPFTLPVPAPNHPSRQTCRHPTADHPEAARGAAQRTAGPKWPQKALDRPAPRRARSPLCAARYWSCKTRAKGGFAERQHGGKRGALPEDRVQWIVFWFVGFYGSVGHGDTWRSRSRCHAGWVCGRR
jgi:hypothetical protein